MPRSDALIPRAGNHDCAQDEENTSGRQSQETPQCEAGGRKGDYRCRVLGKLEKVPLCLGPAHHTAYFLALGVAVVPGCPRRCQEWVQPLPGTPTTLTAPSPQEAGTQLSAKRKECVTGALAASLPSHLCSGCEVGSFHSAGPSVPPEGTAWTPIVGWYIQRYSYTHLLPSQLLGSGVSQCPVKPKDWALSQIPCSVQSIP